MIKRVIKFSDEEEKDILKGMFDLVSSQRFIRGRIKMHSELTWKPATDVIETADELIILVDISGMQSTEISVITDGKTLRIRGVRKAIGPEGKKQFHKLEIPVGPFERTIEIPVPVDYKNVSANYDNGLLKVTMRKVKPTDEVKRVKID